MVGAKTMVYKQLDCRLSIIHVIIVYDIPQFGTKSWAADFFILLHLFKTSQNEKSSRNINQHESWVE